MKSGYPFLCGERPEGEFPRQCFLYVTKGSVKLFPLHRRDVGVLEIMLIGPFFGFYSCLSLLLFLFVPSISFYWALLPVLVFEMTKGWSWAVQAAFQSSLKRSSSHREMQIDGLKYRLVNHRLQGHAEGKRTTLIVSCRRRTLADALKLVSSENAGPSAVP